MNQVKKLVILAALVYLSGCNDPASHPNIEDVKARIYEHISDHKKAPLEKINRKEFRIGFRLKGLTESRVLKTHAYNSLTSTSGLEVMGEEVQIVELIGSDVLNSQVSFVMCDTSAEPNVNLCHRTSLGRNKFSPMQFVYYPILSVTGKVDNTGNTC